MRDPLCGTRLLPDAYFITANCMLQPTIALKMPPSFVVNQDDFDPTSRFGGSYYLPLRR
jgi:hypothetical protein